MGTFGQCMKNMKKASRLIRVQSRQNLMIPGPRSLNLFTRKPPKRVPPPPAGTTRYPEGRGSVSLRVAPPGFYTSSLQVGKLRPTGTSPCAGGST